MDEFIRIVRVIADGTLDGASDAVVVAMGAVLCLLVVVSIFSAIVSIGLAISYIKYNKTQNRVGKTGEEIARNLLDKNGLGHIRVSKSGSMLFGNSYSHYFKKVRLRRRTWRKTSIASLAMAAQKSSLAVLDKENDPDMKKRIRLTPFIYFGPLAFVPLVVVGVLLDMYIFKSGNTCTVAFSAIGLVFYLLSFIMSILVIKTEKKAQEKALELMKEDGLAVDSEIEMCRKLFHLYNIEYVNNMIVALLELIYRILQIVAYAQGDSLSTND